MKVFLSWSGNQSHKVALIFRDWLPSVIQSIVPYVSSEDIDKGARWSTDIAKELENSTFGILCVTKENQSAPWLTFEAGALSKTMDKSYVTPFLFDLKRSEVDGPILQFQSTIFLKEDIHKLIKTLNNACESEKLTEDRLEKAFEVWYPRLEEELKKIKPEGNSASGKEKAKGVNENSNEIIEEILELSRLNQKLLRTFEGNLTEKLDLAKENIAEMNKLLIIGQRENNFKRHYRRLNLRFLEELSRMSFQFRNYTMGLQFVLSLLREDFPWIYDSGKEVIDIIKSRKSFEEKRIVLQEFLEDIRMTLTHPIMREMSNSKEMDRIGMELPYFLDEAFGRLLNDIVKHEENKSPNVNRLA